MGFSTPALRKIGYTATDDVIYQDTNEYQTVSTTFVEVITGELIETPAGGSIVRFKVDLKTNDTSRVATMQMKIDGAVVWTETSSSLTYSTRTKDIDISVYLRGAPLSVEIKTSHYTAITRIKNFSLCGHVSPFVF